MSSLVSRQHHLHHLHHLHGVGAQVHTTGVPVSNTSGDNGARNQSLQGSNLKLFCGCSVRDWSPAGDLHFYIVLSDRLMMMMMIIIIKTSANIEHTNEERECACQLIVYRQNRYIVVTLRFVLFCFVSSRFSTQFTTTGFLVVVQVACRHTTEFIVF